MVVRGTGDRVLHVAFFQRLVKLRLGKGRIAAEDYLFAERLLAFNLGQQQQFLPAVGAMDVAGPQFGGQAVAFTIEQQQRMVTGRLEMAVVGALLLLAIDRDFSTLYRA
jgi:hypothetical protein